MQTRHYDPTIGAIIVETLKQSNNNRPIDLSEIAQASRTTGTKVGEVLSELLGIANISGTSLCPSARVVLARVAVQLGVMDRAVRALTWQEFEAFSEECLSNNGFETQKGVVISDSGRRWQIDLVAEKGEILLTLDCKHWETANYPSRFKRAIQHQKLSVHPLVRYLKTKGRLAKRPVWALPVILTLFELPDSNLDGVVIVSVGQLSDFLGHLTPYSPELPFIAID